MIVAANLALTACSPETTAIVADAVDDVVATVAPEVGVKPTVAAVAAQKDTVAAVVEPDGSGLKDFVKESNTITKPAAKQSKDEEPVTTAVSTSTNMDDLLTLDADTAVEVVELVDFALYVLNDALDLAFEDSETIPEDNIWSECTTTLTIDPERGDNGTLTIDDCEGTLQDDDDDTLTVYMEADLTFKFTETDLDEDHPNYESELDINGEVYVALMEQDEGFFVMGLEDLELTIEEDSIHNYVDIDADLLIVEYDAEEDTSISGWVGLETILDANGRGLKFASSDEDDYQWIDEALSGSIELEDETDPGMYTVTFYGNEDMVGTVGTAN